MDPTKLAIGFLAMAPFLPMLTASCGGDARTTTSDAGGDASAALDGSTIDGTSRDDGGDAAVDARDAPDGSGRSVPSVLGSADKLAVFSGGTIDNATGTATTITGDLGTYPSTAALAFTPPVVVGTKHLGDAVAQTAAIDIQLAYDKLVSGSLACGTDMTGVDLGGKTLAPGVYCFTSTAGLTGTLTLDARNDPDAVWVFQIGSALTTAAASRVVVVNGTSAQLCNVFWQITTAATLGATTAFGGNILAGTAVTLTTGTSVVGRVFALTAMVTTDTNVISMATCPVSAPVQD